MIEINFSGIINRWSRRIRSCYMSLSKNDDRSWY